MRGITNAEAELLEIAATYDLLSLEDFDTHGDLDADELNAEEQHVAETLMSRGLIQEGYLEYIRLTSRGRLALQLYRSGVARMAA